MTAMSRAAEKAADILDQYGNDIWTILDKLEVIVAFKNFGKAKSGLKGFCVSFFGKYYIAINENLPEYLQILIAWHELGHIVLDPDILSDPKHPFHEDFDPFGSVTQTELNANYFAAEGIIDDDELMDLAREGYAIDGMAAMLKVPVEFVIYKIQIMRYYGYDLNFFETPDACCLGEDITGEENF